MKRLVWFVLAVVAVIGTASWLIVITPPSVPSRSLDFTLQPLSFSNGFPRTCSVVLSNVSDFPVAIYGGFKAPWFDIAYLTNGVWQHDYVKTLDRGYSTLPPHTVNKSTIEVPDGATSLKVGLPFTCLTWRGRIAWSIAGSSFSDVLKPVTAFLMRQDERRRSKTEWSDEYHLPQTNNNGINAAPANR
jgi:hypothetical protein